MSIVDLDDLEHDKGFWISVVVFTTVSALIVGYLGEYLMSIAIFALAISNAVLGYTKLKEN